MIFNAFCGKPLPKLTNPGSAGELLTGKQLINANGEIITGSMPNQGAQNKMLNAGGSFTIPAGFHNGSGVVSANSLANQTSATAGAADIASGKTAWVNGQLITGTRKEPKIYTSTHESGKNPVALSDGGFRFSITIPSQYIPASTDVRKCMLCLYHYGKAKYNGGSEESYAHGAIPVDSSLWISDDGTRSKTIIGRIMTETSNYRGNEFFTVTISGNTITFDSKYRYVAYTNIELMEVSLLVYDA